jgi:hypothetical protein
MQNELSMSVPPPDPALTTITFLRVVGIYAMLSPEFDSSHEAIFKREAHRILGILMGALRPMLAPNGDVAIRIEKTTLQDLASMLDFDPATATWAVAVQIECDPNDERLGPVLQPWVSRLYAALRFAMPAEGNRVDDIVDGDPSDVLVLRRLTGEEPPGYDYLEPLNDLPSLLEQQAALLETHSDQEDAPSETAVAMRSNDDAIFACLQPLLCLLMEEVTLWFGYEDGRLRSLNRLRYSNGLIILECGPDSASLEPKK